MNLLRFKKRKFTDEEIETGKSANRLVAYVNALSLPLALVVLFVLQNQIFNAWLGIYSKTYSVRLSLVTFALGVLFYGPALLFKKRLRFAYLFFISFLVSFLFSCQFLYYRYSQSFLQFSAIKYFGQADSIMGTIKALLTPELLVFFSNFIVVLVVFVISVRKSKNAHKKTKGSPKPEFVFPAWEKILLILAMVAIVFFGYKYLLYTEKKEWGSTSRLYTDVYDLKAVVGKMGITNFFLEDTFKYILRSNLVTDKDKEFVQAWEKNKTQAPKSAKYFGSLKDKNVIIIQVESLENSVINQSVGRQEITPRLNQLAKDGLYFDNFYAQVGPGNTADTEFSTMNSLYPLPDDVVFIDYAKNNYKALPQLLAKIGYETYSLHGDVPTFWNRSNIYPGLGYQKAFGLNDYSITRPVGKGPSDLGDEDLFSQSLPRLESFKQPFLATVITMSSHTPFILPDDLQILQIPVDTTLDKNQQRYLQSVNYTDKAIGEFIDGLKADDLYNNSLIFIFGDHGSFTNISSALGRNNMLHALDNSQVPLIILNSGLKNQTVSEPASQIDIYPTIADLLGIDSPATIFGQDLITTKTPIETHFKLVSGGVDAILTDSLAFQANEDGVFEHGSCMSVPKPGGYAKSLPISDCQNIYKEQSNAIKASNILIKGNLLQ